ncbi:MAG TPA: hypothetical protein VGD88_04320 [Opitutaceae bacterium]
MSARSSAKKPWSLKWVAIIILACIIPYTWITIRYRKPGPAFQPYEDSKNRANVLRLLDAGYQRIAVEALRPADPARTAPAGPAAEVTAAPGGLPPKLSDTLVEIPLMPDRVNTVTAPRESVSTGAYRLQFTCSVPDNKEQLKGAEVYVRDRELTLIPTFEKIEGGLLARTTESVVLLEIPAGTLKPGRYLATIVGARQSQRWNLDVR